MTQPTETVTEIVTTYMDHAGFRFAVLTLANTGNRPVTLGPASLARFKAAVLSLRLDGVDAVAVTGKGAVFCAGADLKSMTEATTLEQAENVARQGLDALGRLAALPVPTFAFVNGIALGGGLELALHADYRTVADSVQALGFPEVRLGLVPAWGGIPRTAALLGPARTARLVVTDSLAGKNLSAKAAAGLALVDTVLPEEGFLVASLDFAAGILAGTAGAPSRPGPAEEEGQPAGFAYSTALEAVLTQLDARLHGAAPAPYRALDLIAATDVTAGAAAQTAATIRAFGELLLSDEARASIYAFHLTKSMAKRPTGRPDAEPLSVRAVGVIGAGLMASQLALVFAQQLRVPVHITDLSQERIDSALGRIGADLGKLVDRGILHERDADAVRDLITGGTDKAAFADCDVVIEAVFEELEVKRAVLAELEPMLRPDTLLLTNTSSLSIEAMGHGLAHPERLVGFHFFNPVAVLPLVEIITSPRTDDSSLSTAFELARRLRKAAVLVTDTAGFVVNRVLTRLFSEMLSMIDDGADPATVDGALEPLGLPMTPLQLLQYIGPAVQLHICKAMHAAYPARFPVSTSLAALVASGSAGYLDDEGGISPAAVDLLPVPRSVDPVAVQYRILSALAQEVTAMLDEGVVAGPEQIDLCMILGANYPFHAGGLTPLLDRKVGTTFHPGLRVSQGEDMKKTSDVVIVGAARTPQGRLMGQLASLSATELGGQAISAALDRAGIHPDVVDAVIMGHVLQAGAGQNPARQAAVAGGIPLGAHASTVNKVCLSGLSAIIEASRLLQLGEADVVVAGGQESMSNAPHLLAGSRAGHLYGNAALVDSAAHDGLTDAFDHEAMGLATDRINEAIGIARGEQDRTAADSHRRAAAAQAAGLFDAEIVPVKVPHRGGQTELATMDEGVRPNSSEELLGRLRPAFSPNGTITAGNASPLNDGAAAVVLTTRRYANDHGLEVLAVLGAPGQTAGPDTSLPDKPARAIGKALAKEGWNAAELDFVEINEAFASVALHSAAQLGVGMERININGGAIALGHPIGASGARLVVSAAYELLRRGTGKAAVGLCGGGGQGEALLLSR